MVRDRAFADEPTMPSAQSSVQTATSGMEPLGEIDRACGVDALAPAVLALQAESRRIGALPRTRPAGARIVRRDVAVVLRAHPLDAVIASISADQGTSLERECYALRAVEATAALYLYDSEAMQVIEPAAGLRPPRRPSVVAMNEWVRAYLLPWLRDEMARLRRVEEAYDRVAATKRHARVPLEARSAQGRAAFHIGDAYASMFRVLALLPTPREIAADPALLVVYQRELSRNFEPLRTRALELFAFCIGSLPADGPDASVRALCEHGAASLRSTVP